MTLNSQEGLTIMLKTETTKQNNEIKKSKSQNVAINS